jgi:hypothetical protein
MAILPGLEMSEEINKKKQEENKEKTKDRITRNDDVIDIGMGDLYGTEAQVWEYDKNGNDSVSVSFELRQNFRCGCGRRVSEHCLGAAQRPHGLIQVLEPPQTPNNPPPGAPRPSTRPFDQTGCGYNTNKNSV